MVRHLLGVKEPSGATECQEVPREGGGCQREEMRWGSSLRAKSRPGPPWTDMPGFRASSPLPSLRIFLWCAPAYGCPRVVWTSGTRAACADPLPRRAAIPCASLRAFLWVLRAPSNSRASMCTAPDRAEYATRSVLLPHELQYYQETQGFQNPLCSPPWSSCPLPCGLCLTGVGSGCGTLSRLRGVLSTACPSAAGFSQRGCSSLTLPVLLTLLPYTF